jgi:DNA-binding SARP family transcriptional activator
VEGSPARIRLCGSFELELDGERLEGRVRGAQGRLLLAYLALHRDRPVRREELEEALWGDGRPRSPEALAPPLSRLRGVIGAHRLERRAELRLELGDGAWVDVEAAAAWLADARAALDAGDARRALDAAAQAVQVAAGGLLPGLEAPWLDAHRARIEDLHLEALEVVAAAGARLGPVELPVAERAARTAVELAPFRESARVVLLEVLRARGNVAEALRAFEEARTLLRDELGATPGPALLAAHEQLLHLERERAVLPVASEPGGLVDRGREAARLREHVDSLMAGRGGVAVVEGPAGIGKSRLLEVARSRAETAGARALVARGSELERSFAYGMVRQLFEGALADPDERARALAGAAAPAAAAFDAPGAGPSGDVSFAVLHGLYWLVLNLAAERPTALYLDDLQWADASSLRAFAHLSRRLADTPVLIAASVRSTAPEADAELLFEITHDPAATVVRPGPLSESGVAALVSERLGAPADPGFAAACRRTTGGNPLLLGQLLTALAADDVVPDASSVELVASIGPRAVSSTVLRRIHGAGAEAAAVARAVAVLGDGSELPEVAALAGIDERTAAAGVAALVRADILRDQPPLRFVHPLLREAVYHGVPPGDRELLHVEAAEALRSLGVGAERVAIHLLRSPPRGLPWVADTLQVAGASAMGRGACDCAVPLLTRALAEPPEAAQAGPVLAGLGTAEVLAGDPAGAGHLAQAVAVLDDPDVRAQVTLMLAGTLLLTGDARRAVEVSRRMREQLPPELEGRGRQLLAFELEAVFFGGDDPARLAELEPHRRRPVPPRGGFRMLAALAALQWARTDGEAGECAALALEALGTDRLRANPFLAPAAAHVLVLAEHPQALEILDELVSDAHRQGSIQVLAGAWTFRGRGLLAHGDLDEAETALRTACEEFRRMDAAPAPLAYAGAFLSRTLLERGDPEAAETVLAETAAVPTATEGGRLWAEARLAVLVERGRDEAAVRAGEELSRHPLAAPGAGASDRRSLHALALARLGRSDEARALALDELAAARRWGTPGAIGRALRVMAEVEPERGLEHLREAASVLDASSARLEHAKALAALGRALTAADEARDALDDAYDLAAICGAEGLARDLEQELARLGAPRAAAEQPLTARERRLLSLAGEGLDRGAIAQALFLTPHEVDIALARARAKHEGAPPGLAGQPVSG